jgi:hypothetical protein
MPPLPIYSLSPLDVEAGAWQVCFWAYRVAQDPRDSKSNRLHVVDIFRFCFNSFKVSPTMGSSTTIGNSPQVSNVNRLFLKLNRLFHL